VYRQETKKMNAARSLQEHAEAVGVAAAQIRAARDAIRAFEALSKADPRRAFGHTVREHREAIEVCDEMLRDLCYVGQASEQELAEVGFGVKAVAVIRAAHINLRVMRALAAVLAGDRDALAEETDDVRPEVARLLDEQKVARAGNWTAEELKAFREGPHAFTPEFEAWLDEA
jgi:hypothetical protein